MRQVSSKKIHQQKTSKKFFYKKIRVFPKFFSFVGFFISLVSLLQILNIVTICSDYRQEQGEVSFSSYEKFLAETIEKSPIIELTGRHRIILSVVNKGMLPMTKNFLCSLKYSKIRDNEFVLFAFDEESYVEVLKFTHSVFFLPSDLSKEAVNNQQIVQFYKFLHVRTGIALEYLKRGCDVITSDTDIVYLSNPQRLIRGDCDLEAQHDSKIEVYPQETIPAPWKLNLGFHAWRSNNVTIGFVEKLIEKMKSMPKNHDQSVLRKMTKKLPMKWTNDSVLEVTLDKKTKTKLRVRYIDGLLAVNAGGVFTNNSDTWVREARRRNVKKPVLCHFFHIGSLEEKYTLQKNSGLWFLQRGEGKCRKNPPKGTKWPWWK